MNRNRPFIKTNPRALLGLMIAAMFLAMTFSVPADAQITNAYTRPYQEIQLAISEPGVLSNVFVQLGSQVKAGDKIAELNNRSLVAAQKLAQNKAQSTAAIDAAKAKLDKARGHFNRVNQVHVQGHASSSELLLTRLDMQLAESDLNLAYEESQQATFEVERIAGDISRRVATSPIDGTVIDLPKDAGEYVASSEPTVAKIVSLDKLRIRFHVSTSVSLNLKRGDRVNLEIEEDVTSRAIGVIEYVAQVTGADSSTVRVEVVLDNRDRKWRAGLPCRLVTHNGKHALQ